MVSSDPLRLFIDLANRRAGGMALKPVGKL